MTMIKVLKTTVKKLKQLKLDMDARSINDVIEVLIKKYYGN